MSEAKHYRCIYEVNCVRKNDIIILSYIKMSNHTNKDIYFNKLFINDHVGGKRTLDPPNQTKFIRDQTSILNSDNVDLPPNLRYTNTKHKKDRYDPYVGYLYDNGLYHDEVQARRVKTHFVDLNSAYRNRKPCITTEETIELCQDPLEFQKDSNLLFIKHQNHNLKINDRIILNDVVSKLSILSTFRDKNLPTFEIPLNSNYMKIYHSHNIPLNYTGDTVKIKLDGIIGDRGMSASSAFLGSIPINMINKEHNIKLSFNDFKESPDYFFIILPTKMQLEYKLVDYNFKIIFLSLASIPLNEINAQYPTDREHLNGYHIIKDTNKNGYYIELKHKAIIKENSYSCGGKSVTMSRIKTLNPGYSEPNNYIIELGNVFRNILSVTLISSEIPNTHHVINKNNNKLYWNNLDDGDYLYETTIPPGNYSAHELTHVLDHAFSSVERIHARDKMLNITYNPKHIIKTTINEQTDEVNFSSFKEYILNKPIVDIVTDLSDDTTQLILDHSQHGMVTSGEHIIIKNALSHQSIPENIINTHHKVTEIIDENNYKIKLQKFNASTNQIETNGGIQVSVHIPDKFRMRFDQSNTLGDILGFRNTGESTSVTEYNTKISNRDKYENEIGQVIDVKQKSLQLCGNNYIIMVAEPIKTYTALGPIKHAFAKIITAYPGRLLIDTFVPMYKRYDDPIHELSELKVSFYTPNGELVDFNGIDHSFTLEIVTVSDIPENTAIDADTGKNYNPKI
jgi:hypothetical protein